MTTRSARGRMRWIAGALGIALMLAPASAFAIFPPVTPHTTVTTTGIPVDPVVKIQGSGGGTPITVPPTAKTPEPATIVMGLMGLALAGYFMRKKKPAPAV